MLHFKHWKLPVCFPICHLRCDAWGSLPRLILWESWGKHTNGQFQHICFTVSVVVWVTMPPLTDSDIWISVSVSLSVSLYLCLSLPHGYRSRCKLSADCSITMSTCLLTYADMLPDMTAMDPALWNCKPQINSFLCKLPWPWCFITGIKK